MGQQQGGSSTGNKLLTCAGIGCGGPIALVFVMAIIGSFMEPIETQPTGESGSQEQASTPPAPPEPVIPDFVVTADTMLAEYKNNEVAADMKYDKKVIQITGTIQDIGLDILDDAYIIMGGTGFLDGVQCMFPDSEKASFAQLSKGQQVTVTGKVSGKMGNVIVRQCKIQ